MLNMWENLPEILFRDLSSKELNDLRHNDPGVSWGFDPWRNPALDMSQDAGERSLWNA